MSDSSNSFWIISSSVSAFLIGSLTHFCNLYLQYADLLKASTPTSPMLAAGTSQEIHAWYFQTGVAESIASGLIIAIAGIGTAWLLRRLQPMLRQWLAGSRDNPSFDQLLSLSGHSCWVLIVLAVSIFSGMSSTHQAAKEQTFFQAHPIAPDQCPDSTN